MDIKKQRCVYVTPRQKKKLIELIAKNPQLISNKYKNGVTIRDSQKLWQSITVECNAIAGARKNWRQWRKTWQDLRSKYKNRSISSYRDLPSLTLTPAEQEVLGLKTSPPDSPERVPESVSPQEQTEFVELDEELLQDHAYIDVNYVEALSEPESIPNTKVYTAQKTKQRDRSKLKNSKHSECDIDCDTLTTLEQKKLQVKEDYLNFKKDYLRQKLKLIKEQTEALKIIARELGK